MTPTSSKALKYLIASTGVLAAAIIFPPRANATAPSDEAIAAIVLPDRQLRGFLAAVVFGTQTVPMAQFRLGVETGCKTLRPAFDDAVAKILPTWRANLINAYRRHVPLDTLTGAALVDATTASSKLTPFLDAIGNDMQAASEPLLTRAAGSIVEAMSEAAAKMDMPDMNDAKRNAGLKAALADGSAFCGLLPTREGR